jgi:hypothetical protein
MKHIDLTPIAVGLAIVASVTVPAVASAAPVTSRFDLAAATAKADAAVQQRLTSISTMQGALQQVTHGECLSGTMASQLSADAGGLTALQGQIDALPPDTTAIQFKALSSQITQHYRIYMLETPKTRVVAACDKVFTAAAKLDGLGVGGADAQAARDQATAAVNGAIGLVADDGNGTTRTANKSALLGARSNIKGAIGSLKAGRDAAQK